MTKPGVRVQAPPGGWTDAEEKTPQTIDDFAGAVWDSTILNENLNSEQEAMERAYDLLQKRGEALGMQGLYNPYRADQGGGDRQPLGSAARFLWRPNSEDAGSPLDYESSDVRWKAQQFEEVWKTEAARLGDRAEQAGQNFGARIAEGSRQAVATLATTLRKDSLDKLGAIKAARDSGFFSIDTLTEFGVGMGASLNDPAQVATLAVGAPEALVGKSVLKAGVKEAAVNASVEVLLQPAIQASKLDAGVIEDWQTAVGDGLTNVGMAGALGFVFGAGGKYADNKLFAPGRERTEAFRSLAKDIEAVRFDDSAVQRSVMKMVGDVIEAEGPIQPTASMAEAFRDAAAKAPDPAAAARLSAVAGEIEKALEPPEDPDAKFDRARDALDALGKMTEDADPESAALVRKALYEAERDFATAKQRPDTVPMDEFAEAIEAADARVRALEQLGARPEPALPEPKTRALDTTDDGPSPEVGARLKEDGKSVTFTQFDPMQLGVAPDEMQYKRFSGEQGVNEAISDIQTWHAPSSGKVLVFERLDGSQVIVDGHQRRERARALTQRDGRTDIKLDGYLYKEADGWTVPELRIKGAQKNIREGRSDVLDTAQALRENPNAIDASFPVSRSNISQARKLARLSPEAWDLTRAGVLEPSYAALIGAVAPDRPSMHAPLARTLIEAGPENIRQAENVLSEALLDYAERDVSTQPGLFGDDGLGRGALYKERAQIMDAAYGALRSDRSVFKALVDNGDIARAIGNDLVDQANLTAKDQVELAIAAIMHARRSGTRTAVSDMITRALDSVRREGIAPARAGRQVAREVRALVEAKGFRALLEADGPRPPELSETGPLFDMAGSPAHVAQTANLEGQLRPEGRDDPGVDLKKLVEPPDELGRLMGDIAAPGNGRPLEEVFDEIRALLKPKKDGETKPADARAEAKAELKRLEQADKSVREAIAPLTDAQKVQVIKAQYPDAYAPLSRLEGPDLDDAIVGRVLAGEVMFGRRGEPGSEVTFTAFNNDGLTPTQNKIVEMAMNNYSNLDIATEMGISLATVSSEMSRARRVLKPLGVEVPKGLSGKTIDGQKPGALKDAIFRHAEDGLDSAQIHARLEVEGMPTTIRTVYTYFSMWRAAKNKGTKFAFGSAEQPGLTREGLIDAIRSEFGGGASALMRVGEVNIRDVPEPWMEPDTMGFADMRGRVTLIAGNIRPEEVRGIVLHEIGVHTALHRILGEEGKAAVLQQIEERLAAGDASVVAAHNKAIRADTPAEDLTEETLAYLVMNAPKHGLVKQLIADIRAWLYRTFPMLRDAFTLTDTDLQSLAMGAVRSRIRAAQQVGQFTASKAPSGAVYGGVKVASPNWNGALKLRQLLGEPSKYLPWRNNPRFTEMAAMAGEAVETVPVGAIVPGQSQIRWNFKDVPKRYGKTDADLPWLVREDGKYYIRDGTHRIAAQVDDGAQSVRARVIDLDAAVEAEPLRFARTIATDPNLPGKIPYFAKSGYEARDLILMFNDGLDFARMGTELTLATGIPANPGSLRSQVTYVRTALRSTREDPKLFTEVAEAMRVSEDELNGFINNLGNRRAPSMAGEARRLIRDGVTSTADIIKGLKAYAEKHRMDVKAEILDQTVSHARNDLGVNIKGSNAVSTSNLKYARRRDDFGNREAENASGARAGDGELGRDGGAGNAGSGAAAPRGRANLRSVQPVRSMAQQPLPPTRYVGGDWNDRVDLSPEQRAERREQFREFVDTAIVEHDASKFPTTWAFKNGKRYEGAMRIVETRRYRVRQTEDMHADWLEVLEPEETGLTAEIHGGEATIHDSNVAFELRSTGIGQKLYMQAIDDMLAAGLVVNSDVSVSVNATALWKSLRKQGYDVVQRVPDALLEMGDDGQYAHSNASVAVFYIAGKKPRAPDLPATERDVMNGIDEARDLADHLPKCLKGKRNG